MGCRFLTAYEKALKGYPKGGAFTKKRDLKNETSITSETGFGKRNQQLWQVNDGLGFANSLIVCFLLLFNCHIS